MSCRSCRVIRRNVIGQALGVIALWEMSGAAPLVGGDMVWRGLLCAAMGMLLLSVMLGMRQMHARWRG
ncbi:hypothetical protein [Cereibacter sphaeroides]|uniref:hypothetical protein n=1 Tax=Cereibacter sphaeroides TaxID=1063 RepID=UPI001F1E86A1|nr:hypothetical protein [Cereibacter sphaeroides]MCE6968374.1 hypothetical protein [Cereibacter sphaeroides]